MSHLKIAAIAALVVSTLSTSAFADVSLAVSSPRGEAQATAEWSEFARYVESKIGEPVVLTPVAVGKVDQLIAEKKVDFAMCNPVQAVGMSQSHGMQLVASLVLPNGAQFGGVIIANPKAGIAKVEDLKGKKVAALGSTAAGAYLFQAFEATKRGLKVPGDLAQVMEMKKQDDIVLAVKAGVADAGFIRTGQLESMLKEGKITESDVLVIDRKPGFPGALSTTLYPEWYLISVTGDAAKTAKVKAAALSVAADSPAAKKANIKGFAEPLDAAPIVEMMKALKVTPFN